MKEKQFIWKTREILVKNDRGLITDRKTILELMRLFSKYTLKLVQVKPHK